LRQEISAVYTSLQIEIFESDWPLGDPEKKKSGVILSEQTNLALDRCTGDWCVYLQADEVFHELDYALIESSLDHANSNPVVNALVFQYRHLYGSYGIEQYSRTAYRREVRAIRRLSGLRSKGDAQSFIDPQGQKPQAIMTEARVFHYGWVRTPEAMREKTFFMDQLYHGDPTKEESADRKPKTGNNYRYKRFWGLRKFRESHPAVMEKRITAKNWIWDLEASPLEWRIRDVKKIVLDSIELLTGVRLFEYRSYRFYD
jgi:hypothetical protein